MSLVWTEKSSFVEMKNPVFLICSERSGSNLIRAMIGSHSGVEAPRPLHIWRDCFSYTYPSSIDGIQERQYQAILKQLVQTLKRHYGQDFVDTVLNSDQLPENPSVSSVIRCVYDKLLIQSQKHLLFIKENNVQKYIAPILNSYPSAKFIFQVRDPRDFLLSCKSLRKGRFGNKFGSVHNALEVWHEDQKFGLQMQSHLGRDRIHFLKYESLIENPERELREVCEFLAIEFEAGMLEFHKREQNVEFSQKGKQWRNIGKPLLANNSGKFLAGLSKRDIRSVEAYCKDLMLHFDYKLTEPDRVYSKWDLFLPKILQPIELYSNKMKTPFFQHSSAPSVEKIPSTGSEGSFSKDERESD